MKTTGTATPRAAKHGRFIAGVIGFLIDWTVRGRERARQRHALALLNDTQLRDIGLTRRDMAAETAKPFWRG